MKKSLYLLGTSMLLLVNSYSQTPDSTFAIKYLDEMLSAGPHKVELLEKDVSDDLRNIILKYRESISGNMDWYSKYSQEHAGKDPLPYHKNFGITSQEYDNMNIEFASSRMKVKAVKSLNVNKTGEKIEFSGDNNFTIFDAVVVDLENNVLIVDERRIPYSGKVNENGLAGEHVWSGHRWLLEVGSMEDVKAFKPVDYTMIDLSIGRTATSDKVIVIFKAIYVEEGKPVLNGSVTAYLN